MKKSTHIHTHTHFLQACHVRTFSQSGQVKSRVKQVENIYDYMYAFQRSPWKRGRVVFVLYKKCPELLNHILITSALSDIVQNSTAMSGFVTYCPEFYGYVRIRHVLSIILRYRANSTVSRVSPVR